jgi:hypothetical protein
MSLHDLLVRFWQELVERPSGPLAFRFILQPVMASYLAVRDGWHDAEMHRSPYFWAILHDPESRGPRLREGLVAVLRVLALGAVMDLIYQIARLHGVRPLQTVVVALVLAFLPYLIVRGPAARIGRKIIARRERAAMRTGTHPPASTGQIGRRER